MVFLHDYQTLIAAVLQLVVAYFALRPVYRQLGLARIQSAITTREVLIERMEAAERQRQQTAQQMSTIGNDLAANIFHYDEDESGEPDVNPQWAHDAEQRVLSIIHQMSDRQDSKADPQVVDEPRARVIGAAKSLADCLCDLHQWTSVDFEDPESGIADPVAAKATAEAACDEAAKVIGARINAVRTAAHALDSAFGAAITDLRGRIRQINERVLEENRA